MLYYVYKHIVTFPLKNQLIIIIIIIIITIIIITLVTIIVIIIIITDGCLNTVAKHKEHFYYDKLSFLLRLYCLPSSVRLATKHVVLRHTFCGVITITKC